MRNDILRGTFFAVLFAGTVCSCAGPTTLVGQDKGNETFYVSMLGTRKHRLSGVNPVVGLFYSKDAGRTWRHSGWEQGKAFAAVSPSGSQDDTIFVAAGNGVMRTLDGGDHWRITTGWEVTEVQDIALSARRRSDVFAATPYGIFRSKNLGSSWSHVAGNLVQPFVATIRVDRTDADRVYAGTEAGLYISSDGGDTWTPATLRDPVRSIRQSPTADDTWVAALQDRGVAVTDDRGQTWTIAGDLAGHTIYEVEFDPWDSNRLLAGGWKTGLLESTDLGAHWSRIDEGLPSQDIHGIALSRLVQGLVVIGTMDEGVFISSNGGTTWTAAAPDIFEAGQVWDVYVGGEE